MSRLLQIRRGVKADLPTLSTAELGWCTDTEEFYIGGENGNVLLNKDDVFVAEYNTTSYDDVKSAYDAGKHLIVHDSAAYGLVEDFYAPLSHVIWTPSGIFTFTYKNGVVITNYTCDVNGWNSDSYNLAYASEIELYTLLAENWSEDGTYDFEGDYPSARYDVSIESLSQNATIEMATAFGNAGLLGNTEANILKAIGTIPDIDIEVIVKVVKK